MYALRQPKLQHLQQPALRPLPKFSLRLAQLTSRQLVAVEHKQNAEGFSGEFNLRTVGPDAFKEVMVNYFATKGFVTTSSSTQHVFENVVL